MNYLRNFRTKLAWKLMLSYVIVILAGMSTLVITAEIVIPAVYNHHLQSVHHSVRHQLADLLDAFWPAATKSLFLSVTVGIIFALLTGFIILKRIDLLLNQIIYTTRRIADGHYQERVRISGEDELKQVAESFNLMASSLEQTEDMRRDLIANVGHELRTPVTNIKIYAEGLIDGVLPADLLIYQRIRHEADRLQQLLNDLQKLSRAEAGAFTLNLKPLSLDELIQEVVEYLLPQFEEQGTTLNVQIQPRLPLVIADRDRLFQIFLNLTGNALQYTPAGGRVTISAALPSTRRKTQKHILLSIADNGIGIPAEHLPLLFDRFYRVDKSRSRAGGGSGIGLTIVKHLVEAHKGSIWAESKGEGKGSVFYFTLPLA